MSEITRAGTAEAPAGGSGAETYIVDVDANGGLSKASSSLSTSSVDDCDGRDDRVQYAGG